MPSSGHPASPYEINCWKAVDQGLCAGHCSKHVVYPFPGEFLHVLSVEHVRDGMLILG